MNCRYYGQMYNRATHLPLKLHKSHLFKIDIPLKNIKSDLQLYHLAIQLYYSRNHQTIELIIRLIQDIRCWLISLQVASNHLEPDF